MVKNLSILGNITVMIKSQIYIIKGFLKDKLIDIRNVKPLQLAELTKVFLNGEWLGVSEQPLRIYKALKNMKLNGRLEPTVSITYNVSDNEIKIYCDGGRLFRPVFRVENNRLMITRKDINDISIEEPAKTTQITRWTELMTKKPGLIEFLDTDENHEAMTAMYPKDVEKMRQRMHDSANIVRDMKDVDLKKMVNRYDNTVFVNYTHCEFHPALLIGGVSSNIPFCNHNQGPRNIYQYSQARQAMGIYASNYRDRLDIAYILYHPQRPIINTRTIKYINTDKLAAGENCIVAIACYTGYNQEDSVIMNRTAIERGLFRATAFKKYQSIIEKNQSTSQDDQFMKPTKDKVSRMKQEDYYFKLNEKGFAPEETVLHNGDMIIGKVKPVQTNGPNDLPFKDDSEAYKSHVPGAIDKVYSGIYNADGYEMVKIRVRSERIPHIGDKFCLTEDHDVLTENGWIPIKNITNNMKVATLDGENIKYEYPIDVYNWNYEGDIFEIDNEVTSFKATPDHMIYVKTLKDDKYKTRSVASTVNKDLWFKNDNKEFYTKGNYKVTDYKGTVYCLEVPSHVFMIRRNGKHHWTGNCSRHKLTVPKSIS